MIRSLSLLLALLLVAGRASACCDTVRFDSTGLLAESENKYIIGTYTLAPEGGYYECPENGLSLYYYSDRGVSTTSARLLGHETHLPIGRILFSALANRRWSRVIPRLRLVL